MFGKVKRMSALLRSTVIKYRCDGCMGHHHEVEYVGKIVGFERSKYVGTVALIKIMKQGNRDIRDGDLGADAVSIFNTDLQQLDDKLWAWFV